MSDSKVKVKLSGWYQGGSPGDYVEVDAGDVRRLVHEGVIGADSLSKSAQAAMNDAAAVPVDGDNTPDVASVDAGPEVAASPKSKK